MRTGPQVRFFYYIRLNLFIMDIFDEFIDEFFASIDKKMNDLKKNIEKTYDVSSAFFKKRCNYKIEEHEDANNTWTLETWTDITGMFKYSRKVTTSKTFDSSSEETTTHKPTIDELKVQMRKFADNLDYEKAAIVRNLIKDMESGK